MNKKKYKKLHELFFNIFLRSFVEFVDLKSRDDFEKMTDHDLYKERIIPSEIIFQFFLIEVPIKRKDFDWNRHEKIMKQNLACLIVCFSDMYSFFHKDDYDQLI